MNKVSLQVKLTFSILILLTISNIVFASLIFYVSIKFEEQVLETQINQELNQYLRNFTEYGATPFRESTNLSLYFESNENEVPIPDDIKELEPGIYHAIEWENKSYQVAVRDIDNDRIFMVLDISNFEIKEKKFLAFLIAGSSIMPIIAILLSLWHLTRIIRPVRLLADEVGRLNPKERNIRIGSDFRGYEVELIASAFDRYLKKIDEFVEREQFFSAAASHELRTPLAIITTSSELITSNANLPENIKTPAVRIQRAAQSMSTLISALLFLVRESDGNEDPDVETEISALLEKIAENYQLLINEQKISLAVHYDKPTIINAPAEHISIIISNLLQNSIFHTNSGLISLKLENNRIIVTDTGTGIAQQEMANIFTREYRGKNSRGHGFGLYIAKRICDRHGWNLHLQSNPNQGTTAILDFKP